MTFGDFTDEDAFDADAPEADPVQAAIRFHEIRVQLQALKGQFVPHWEDLMEEDRDIAIQIVLLAVAMFRREGVRL